MVDPDLDDTAVPARRRPPVPGAVDLDDTIVTAGRPRAAPAPRLASPPSTEPAPARYGFRVGPTGASEPLTGAVYVGRAPRSPRITTGAAPRLVTVPSPKGEVSGTHLEIRQLGASVVVTDLRSTNGSVVAVPGIAPHTLRPGESMVVSPGTLVDIGDGNVVEILPLQRHRHDGAVQHDTSEGVA
jgi:hypothetical protein